MEGNRVSHVKTKSRVLVVEGTNRTKVGPNGWGEQGKGSTKHCV